MLDILPDIKRWLTAGQQIVLATVVQTWGSAPRPIGSHMAIAGSGEIAGSVSGGCVEGAVVEAGLEAIQTGRAKLLHFGVADETAWQVGLSCGGTIEVFVRPLDQSILDIWLELYGGDKSFASVMIIQGPETDLAKQVFLVDGELQSTFGGDLDQQALDLAQSALTKGQPQRHTLENGSIELFIEVQLSTPTLIVVGGVHIAIPLVSMAKTLGYRTVVIDPRRMFGSQERFPDVDQLIQAWPEDAFAGVTIDDATAIAMLTHDPKIDDPALKIALNGPAFYIGALGSRKTHAKRCQRLLDDGITQAQIDRLHAPIGLNLGGRSPEEIALSVMAEIVQSRNRS